MRTHIHREGITIPKRLPQRPAATTADDRGDMDWGWIGLLGLIAGLAGLMGIQRRDVGVRTTTART